MKHARLLSLFLALLLALTAIPGAQATVFGADDRIPVENPDEWPYSAIARMTVQFTCGCSTSGTGFMAAKDCLMTSAHLMRCPTHLEPLARVNMYFGYRSANDFLTVFRMENPACWHDPAYFKEDGTVDPARGYAYFRMPSSIADKTGYFGLAAPVDGEFNRMPVELAGYSDGVIRTSRGFAQPRSSGSIACQLDVDAPSGLGAPIFDADCYVVALVAAEDGADNIGCRITRQLIQDMCKNGLCQ